MANFCQIQWLGQMEYGPALKLQKELVAKRVANKIPNTLLLLEHPHTYTMGIDGHREHLLIKRDEMTRLNIAYHRVDRGGPIIYYGPGQLVVYPILNLRDYGYSYHRYLAMLESVIIRTLSPFKIHAFRQPGQRGVWVLPSNTPHYTPNWVKANDQIAKIGTIGVKVNKEQVTSHGFSINVDPNLDYFDFIVPHGIQSCYITSMRYVLDESIKVDALVEPVIQSFCKLFELDPLKIDSLSFANKVTMPQAASFHSKGYL